MRMQTRILPPIKSDAYLQPLFYRQILHGSFMNLHASIASGQGSPWLLSEPPKIHNFDTVK
jgi:hypothetical protein